MSRRNAKPSRSPTTAGTMAVLPLPISIEGINSDHTDAATITPEAKPSNAFCSSAGISFLITNTNAEPRIVPSRGIKSAIIIDDIMVECADRIVG